MSNRQAINREQWLDLLRSCSMHHRKQAQETAPTIIGQQPTEEHILHKVWSMSIDEAVELISLLPTIDDDEDDDEDGLPQHRKGPIG
tara:strand:+ start:971 stop:1231 length:261 start_codon:yes stop_codon:yes gene_type:complete